MAEAQIIHVLLRVVVGASIAHIILPPYEVFADFPRAQKYYKLLLAIVAWLALNVRTKLIMAYPSAKAAMGPANQIDSPPTP